jgi:chitinase
VRFFRFSARTGQRVMGQHVTWQRRRGAIAIGVSGAMIGAAGLVVTQAANAPAASAATSGGIKVAYYDQWSIYQNAFYPKALDTEGIASKLNYLIYDFENIDPANLTCFETTKATDPDPGGESDPNAGDGAGDQFADYQKEFGAADAVNGVADVYNQPIAGNFNQLKELKAKYPNLKILLSLGGWTYSKYFSDVAASAASRQKFVSSCVSMFINGNIPASGGFGGNGTAANIFDGFDIDWEYPGSSAGHVGNHYSAADTANFTALLQEFRNELNTAGSANGKSYALSAALPSGPDKVSKIQTNQIAQYLTFGDVMTYDMYGAWNATGPTDEQDPLYANPNSAESKIAPGNETYSIDGGLKAWTAGDSQYGISGGFPASKLTLGLPFYYRGWTGVPAGSNHGLYQSASGPSAGQTLSGSVPGVAMYKEISNIVANSADTYWDPVTRSAYFYDGTNFYGGESAQSIQARADYVHCNGFDGFMMFSLYDLDPAATLFNDAVNDVNGSASGCTTPSGSASASASASKSASPSASPSTSPSPSKSPSSSPSSSPSASPSGGTGGNHVVNPGFETGSLSPWSCTGNLGSVVSSPVHGGSHALRGAPSNSDDAQCSQTISVSPNTKYTLSGWVNGSYVYIGVTGTGTTDTSTWTPGTGGAYSQLSVSFTTGASTTSVTVYVHGWYAQGNYYADDFSVA